MYIKIFYRFTNNIYIGGMYRRLMRVPVGSLKLTHLATASRVMSEVHRTIQDKAFMNNRFTGCALMYTTHSRRQVKWTFLQWQPSCQKPYVTYPGMYNIWHYVHISISMDMKCQPMITQHTGSLNNDTKTPNIQKETITEMRTSSNTIFSPPHTCALPFFRHNRGDLTCIKKGVQTSLCSSILIQLQPSGLK